MTTPNLLLEQIPSNSLQPGVAVNDAFQLIDALLPGVAQAITATPPTTTASDAGKVWIVATGATGAWSGKTGQLAIATGANLWRYAVPKEGWRFDVGGAVYRFDGDAWEEVAGEGGGPAGAAVAAITAAAHNLVAADMGKYNRTTYAGAAAVTVQTNAAEAIPVDAEVHFRAVGGALTLTPASGVTLNAPAGGTVVVPQHGTVTLKKVATNEWDVIGVTEAAP